MKRATLFVLALACTTLGPSRTADAHCEVPCGVYGDQMRFDGMLEDQTTIKKAMTQIRELAGKADADSVNQRVRWVMTKESHATSTQKVIAQYFMTQRIKAKDPQYVDKLTKAHAVMVAAMKAKQKTDDATADALRAAILSFHKAYEAKPK